MNNLLPSKVQQYVTQRMPYDKDLFGRRSPDNYRDNLLAACRGGPPPQLHHFPPQIRASDIQGLHHALFTRV